MHGRALPVHVVNPSSHESEVNEKKRRRMNRTHALRTRHPVDPTSETTRRKMNMRNRIVLGTLLLLCAVAMVTPASAVTVNGVDYVILAKSAILMENSADCIPLPVNTLGCTIINGNVGVSDTTGTLKIGSNNIINGSATAHS